MADFLDGKNGSKLGYLDQLDREAGRHTGISLTLGIGDRFRTRPRGGRRASGDYMDFCDIVLQQMFRRYPELASRGISTWKWQSSGSAAVLKGPGHETWGDTMAPMLDHYESGPGRDGSVRYLDTVERPTAGDGGGWFDW